MVKLSHSYEATPDAVLLSRWREMFGWRAEADAAFEVLRCAYRQPRRSYHTIEHACEVAIVVQSLRAGLSSADTEAVTLAAWAHDAIFEAGASDNEERTAVLARTVAEYLGLTPDGVEMVHELVLASSHRSAPTSRAQQILCDADLSVLAKPWREYVNDVQSIRYELGIDCDQAWLQMRLSTVEHFLRRSPLYYGDVPARRWLTNAVANLKRERAALQSSRPEALH